MALSKIPKTETATPVLSSPVKARRLLAPDRARAVERVRVKLKQHVPQLSHREGVPDEAKRFMVEMLACYCRPKDVIKAVDEVFGIEITRQALQVYNPETVAGRRLSQEYRALFYNTRAKYEAGVNGVGIWHQQFRVEQLEKIFYELKDRGAFMLAANVLKQVAREAGGYYQKKGVRSEETDPLDLLARTLGVPKDQLPPPLPLPRRW